MRSTPTQACQQRQQIRPLGSRQFWEALEACLLRTFAGKLGVPQCCTTFSLTPINWGHGYPKALFTGENPLNEMNMAGISGRPACISRERQISAFFGTLDSHDIVVHCSPVREVSRWELLPPSTILSNERRAFHGCSPRDTLPTQVP
jgi:hypothetical protein